MLKIKELAPKPSDALQAMVKGLLKQSGRENFLIDMTTFGQVETQRGKQICCGCAATCTIQELAQKNLKPETIERYYDRADHLDFTVKELLDFEAAIDDVRVGRLKQLFEFYDYDHYVVPDSLFEIFHTERINEETYTERIFMTTGTWKKFLPAVRKHIKLLKQHNY